MTDDAPSADDESIPRSVDDDDPDDYADEWDEIDEKVLLAQILTELQQIRLAIQGAEQATEQSDTFECRKCGATVEADARERHASEQHRAPPGAEDTLFTGVSDRE